MTPAPLRGRRVELRRLRRSDASALDMVLRDRRATRWLPPRVRGETGARFVARVLAETRRGDGAPFVIRPLGATEVVGQIRLFHCSPLERNADVGYWIRRSSWGNGFATEALSLACRYGFRSMALARIQAKVVVGNDASRRVLEKVGFQLEGTERRSAVLARGRGDVWSFGLLRGELRTS